MKTKVDIDLSHANRLLNFGPVTLITSKFKEQKNVATVSWVMPISSSPPLVAIAITKKRFTYDLIRNSREFVINIPSKELLPVVTVCGMSSGRELDKFAKAGLIPGKGKKLEVPIIEECLGHLECKVVGETDAGDHVLFIGDIIAAYTDEGVLDTTDIINTDTAAPLLHLGKDQFGTILKL